jgi:protein-tyrosine-phosphatase
MANLNAMAANMGNMAQHLIHESALNTYNKVGSNIPAAYHKSFQQQQLYQGDAALACYQHSREHYMQETTKPR